MNLIKEDKSYMDALTPDDLYKIIIEHYNQYNEEELIRKIEFYFSYQDKTKFWHKNFTVPKILTEEEKIFLSNKELQVYYQELQELFLNQVSNKTSIKRLSKKEEAMLTEEQYHIYLKELRLHDEGSIIDNLSLSFRQLLHPFLSLALKCSLIASGIKIIKMNTEIPKGIGNRPIIFVLTHVGKDDISVFNEVVPKHHYTILSGDYESLHNNIEGFVSSLNKTIYFDMNSKEDRSKIMDRAVSVLNGGDNILCSMEAAWNITPNKIIQDLFSGMIEVAHRSDAIILPVGIERFNAELYGINISNCFFDANNYFDKKEKNKQNISFVTDEIREMMANAKFELYYQKEINKQITALRSDIGNYEIYNEKFKKDILTGWTFTEEIIKQKAYINQQQPENVFSYLKNKYDLLLKMYNFLLNNELPENKKENIENKFIQLYIELLKDIKCKEYPNEIHNYLLSVYTQVNNCCYTASENKINDMQKNLNKRK